MKALSLHPIPADAIAEGEKTIEYRKWSTDHRGKLLICASRFDDGAQFVRGHAICYVTLDTITRRGKMFEWYLKDVSLIEPFPVKGKLYLFDVADSLINPFNGTYEELVEHWRELGLIC